MPRPLRLLALLNLVIGSGACVLGGIVAPQQSRLAMLAPAQAPVLLPLNASALLLGTAGGAIVGGALASRLGFQHLSWAGVPFVAAGLVLLSLTPTLRARAISRERCMNTQVMTVEASPSLVRTTHIVYALHALGLALGAFGAASVIGSFLFGWPSIIAVIINYIYRGDARGSWLESHFDWQIRTFWYALAWALLVGLVSLPLTLVIIGFGTWAVGLFLLGVWAIYRVARGWMRLNAHQPMPA